MRRKIRIDTSDPETKAIWETAKRAAKEVASRSKPATAWRVLEGEPDFFYVTLDGPGVLCTSYGPFDRAFARRICRLLNADDAAKAAQPTDVIPEGDE